MIIVTGGAGFIGSNVVRALNQRGETEILVVDDLGDGAKFLNLVDCEICDYQDKDAFRLALNRQHRSVFSSTKSSRTPIHPLSDPIPSSC